MSQPTTSSIFTAAQSLVGDAAGQIATTAALLPFWNTVVYPEMFQAIARMQVPNIEREFYYTVPAYTTYLDPVSIGITDMGNDGPTLMEERQPGTLLPAISSTSNTTPIVVSFSATPGLGANSEIEINGVSGTNGPLGRWFVSPGVDSTHWVLNGSVTDGSAGTGGTAYLASGQAFTPVYAQTTWEPDNFQMGTSLGVYFWQGGVLKFVGATAPSQIHVTYWASGTAPSNLATPLLDDCQTYSSVRLAGLFAGSKGWYSMADAYELKALGRNRTADGRDGLLRGFVLTAIRSIQRGNIQRQPFRPKGPLVPVVGVSGFIGGFQGGGGTYFNFSNSNTQEYTLTTDISLAVPNGLVPNVAFWMVFIQDSVGGHAVTLSGSQWASSIDPTQWSGPGVPGNTSVTVPCVMKPNGQIILNGVIAGPTAI
jgi:hypothetical protein